MSCLVCTFYRILEVSVASAHRISDKAEAAYRRGDQFEKRRKLMEAWAAWCDRPAADNVVTFTAVVKGGNL